MIFLPFKALGILFSSLKMIAYGFFPGFFTFSISSLTVYLLWEFSLQGVTLWFSIPTMMLAFLGTWLIFGNLSLLFVEDFLVDECQRIALGKVVIPSTPFSLNRLFREIRYSLFLAISGLLVFFISLIPIFGWITVLSTSWVSAYGFLSNVYSRKEADPQIRIQLFFRNWISNFVLGFGINILLFVPILNVFLLGYAQILATLVFLEREKKTI
jgi:uncharacterized protein involved in cysteine biosynthesis